MKTKNASKANTTRLVFFIIALTYNLILGFYLRDFLVLTPTLQVFYLLSALPTLFLTVKINSKAMRSTVYISLILISCMNIAMQFIAVEYFPFQESYHLVLSLCILLLLPTLLVKISYCRKFMYWQYLRQLWHCSFGIYFHLQTG